MTRAVCKPFIWIVCILLGGCAVKSLKTSGMDDTGVRLEKMSIKFDATLPNQVVITRKARYDATISNADRLKAFRNARQLAALFTKQFNGDFHQIAQTYGVSVVTPSSDTPQMNVSITGLKMFCSDWGCQSMLAVTGEMPAVGGRTKKWTFTSDVGQTMVEAPIDDALFKSFAEAMLDAMVKDHLIVKH